MQEYIGEETRYVILQEAPQAQMGELQRQPLVYNTGYGSFTPVGDILSATQFKSKEEAIELANLQNQISQILKQDFNYIVIENYIRRSQITGDVIEPEVPEPEVPEEGTTEV